MRNLVALRRAAWRLGDAQHNEDHGSGSNFAVNLGEQVVYFLDAQSGRITSLAIDDQDAETELLVELNDAILTADGAQWKWIEYVAELDVIVCGSTGGTLTVVDLQSREPEEIGALDGGIIGMAWSSNQEMLAITTGVGSLLVMNTQWEVLHETHLQAHLPSGLSLTAATTIEMAWRDDAQYLALNVAAAVDGASASRSVRKVLVFTHELALHALGRLEDGRDLPHLGASLDWCPNHSLVASHETRKDQLFVVFFERNGLRHGEFALPVEYTATTTTVVQIKWNTQSDVLAVHVEVADTSRLLLWTRSNYHWYLKQEIAFDRMDHTRLRQFGWDDECSTLLHLLISSPASRATSYQQFEFVSDVSCGERRSASDQSSVVTAVIDGHKLLLTPVHQALVPPPMALHTLSFPAPVNSVAFDSVHETLAVALSSGDVVMVENYLAENDASTQRVIHCDPSITSLLFFVGGGGSGSVLAAKTGPVDALVVWSIHALESESHVKVLIPSEDIVGVARACAIGVVVSASSSSSPSPADAASARQFALQTHDGRLCTVSIRGANANDQEDHDDIQVLISPLALPKAPLFARLQVVQLADEEKEEENRRLLTLGISAATTKLFADCVQVTNAAVSSFHFCVFSSVLLYTTLGSAAELRFVPLAALVSDAPQDTSQNNSQSSSSSRVIERGARLVAVVGDRASVVLQMPRGNLEGTSPRLLVLALVAKLIERLEYATALEMSRRHRLDLNLLVDYDATQFLTHFADRLIGDYLTNRSASICSDRLCLFITNLHIVDVWATKYGPQLQPFLPISAPAESAAAAGGAPEEEAAIASGQDKVNSVCQAMMRVIQDIRNNNKQQDNQDALLLPFLTACVKQSPPDFQAALAQVQHLLRPSSSTGNPHQAKRAMKHLIFLTQVDLLFDEALGLYDLPLVRFIASYSQRDPKDYMPFLDECDAVAANDDLLRQYKIDLFLKRHTKALTHLSKLLARHHAGQGGDDDDREVVAQYEQQAVEIIVQGQLYDQAILLFPRASSKTLHTKVLQLKGDFLATNKQWEASGYVFLSIGKFHEAMQAFKSARLWQMALCAAEKAYLPAKTDRRAFAYELTEALLSQNEVSPGDVLAAARIYVEYCEDVDEAVALLVKHKQWDESVRVACLHERHDLMETDIEPGVVASSENLCEEIGQRQAEYVKQWKRLTTIREQKRLFKLHGIDGSRWENNGGGDGGAGGGDTNSMASGVSSVADSALSNASSMRSVGSHNSAARNGNFAMQSLTSATSSHFYATQSQSRSQFGAASAAAYKAKRYGGLPSRQERRRRIKEGSVEEEVHVAKQLRANAPSASLLRETRDVLRALVFFGHLDKAETLQNELSAFELLIETEYPMLEMPAATATTETTTTTTSTTSTTSDNGVPSTGGAAARAEAAVEWRFPSFAGQS